jgi:peptidoglycan L-alanyl-D-glutamate endopeptidase CwlK
MNVQQLVMAVQKKLGVTVDGHPGPETWQAIYRSVVGADAAPPPHAQDPVDDRSETCIAKLQPPVQPYARALVHAAAAAGIEIKVISGFRSYQEQDELFAQGRTKPGKRVTNCKGGESNHNFGVAFDIGVFDGKHYLPESPSYDAVGVLGKELGLDWGGDWASLVDKPHFELRPDWAATLSEPEMLAELRRRNDSGTPYYTA